MRKVLAALLLAALPASAAANPVSAGISVGLVEDKLQSDADANQTFGLFGRLGLTKRLSGQLELSKTQMPDEYNYNNLNIRKMTALLVVDLMDHGSLMPVLFAGAGLDRASSDYSSTSGHHFEGGLGLEYRAQGGLTLGIDVRMGGRSIDGGDDVILPANAGEAVSAISAPCGGDEHTGILPIYAPYDLQAGEYRTARITLGIKF